MALSLSKNYVNLQLADPKMKFCFRLFFLLFFSSISSLQAHIPSPIEFFDLDQTKLPNYGKRLLLDQIVVYLTPEEKESENFAIIFISKLCEKLELQIQQNSDFVFNYRFDGVKESLLMRLLFMEKISENKFSKSFSFIEIMYKSYLLDTALRSLRGLLYQHIISQWHWNINQKLQIMAEDLSQYFEQQNSQNFGNMGNLIRFNLWQVWDNVKNSGFLMTAFSSSDTARLSFSNLDSITPLSRASFSIFLKNELIKRFQYLNALPLNPVNRFKHCRQFSILYNICAWLAT